MEKQEAYNRAKKRLEAKQGFYVHAVTYVAVMVMLAIINLTTSPDYLWFLWPLAGWGIGLLFNGLAVFGIVGKPVITEEMIQKEMGKEVPKK